MERRVRNPGWIIANEMRFIPACSSACAPLRCISHTPPSLSGGKRSRQNCLLKNKTIPSAAMRINVQVWHFIFTINTHWRSVLTFGIFSALTRFGLVRNRNAEHANIIVCVIEWKHRIVCLFQKELQLSYHALTEVCPFSSPSSLDQ